MKPIEDFEYKIIEGDNLKVLKEMPSDSVSLIITSPPYFQQRDYGGKNEEIGNEEKVEDYVENLMKVFRECVRILKKDGSIIFNVGDKYKEQNLLLVPYRFALKVLEEGQVKLVNEITWVKLNPVPKQYAKRLINSKEPFFHFVKSKNYFHEINSFLMSPINKKNKNGNGIGKKYFELIKTSDLSPEKKEKANTELKEIIDEVKRGEIEGFRMKIKGIHALPYGGQQGGRMTQILTKGFTIIKIHGNGLKRDIIESPVETIKGIEHPAIYPEYVVKELIKLLTKEGDIVLDPFIGSGTTAVASKKMGRKYIGIDINKKYCKDAEKRLQKIKKDEELEEFII
jgi:DNA modification methylase